MANKTNWGMTPFTLHNESSKTHVIHVSGRDRWALECLMAARSKGCTPIETPGPRWSAYVFSLRALGIAIETIHETHGGPFKGTHARYVLRSRVTRGNGQEAA